jgi:hypothetical protein
MEMLRSVSVQRQRKKSLQKDAESLREVFLEPRRLCPVLGTPTDACDLEINYFFPSRV